MTPASAKPKILIIGDAVAPTGFARVIRSIFEPLHNDYELHQLATRYDGSPHNYPWKLSAAPQFLQEAFGAGKKNLPALRLINFASLSRGVPLAQS